jgi:ComF family protein
VIIPGIHVANIRNNEHMKLLEEIRTSFFHLLFPHICAGCGSDLLSEDSQLCTHCLSALPETNFSAAPNNPVEKKFWGRLPVEAATAIYAFTKESLVQHLMHAVKYNGNKELGLQLGRLMAESLVQSGRFQVDALVPVPLFPEKERKRGYNQSAVLCDGMKEILQIPVLNNIVIRPKHTETQTKKGRIERWKNIEGKFELRNPAAIANQHVLLVDDVITTGATLESCGAELLKAENVQLSIATLCYSAQ